MSDGLTSIHSDWTRTSDRGERRASHSDPFLSIAVHQPPKPIDPSPVTSHWLPPCYRAAWHVPELSYTLLEVQSLRLLDLGALLCSAFSFLLGLHGWSSMCTAARLDKSLRWYQSDQGVVSPSLHFHKRILKSLSFCALPIHDLLCSRRDKLCLFHAV